LAFINLLEEDRNVTHLPALIKLLRGEEFLLCSDPVRVRGSRRSPAVVPDEYGVIALLEVFVDQALRSADSWERVLPANRVKRDHSRLGIAGGIRFQRLLKGLPFVFEAAGRTDEDTILGNGSRH
jgi:hypothetical protein